MSPFVPGCLHSDIRYNPPRTDLARRYFSVYFPFSLHSWSHLSLSSINNQFQVRLLESIPHIPWWLNRTAVTRHPSIIWFGESLLIVPMTFSSNVLGRDPWVICWLKPMNGTLTMFCTSWRLSWVFVNPPFSISSEINVPSLGYDQFLGTMVHDHPCLWDFQRLTHYSQLLHRAGMASWVIHSSRTSSIKLQIIIVSKNYLLTGVILLVVLANAGK